MESTESKKSKNIKFWPTLIRPIKLCWAHKSRSVLWGIYIIIGGLLGVVINLITRWMCGGMSFQEALYVESTCGTFYTFSIVLISAAIGPLFFNLSETKILHFPDIKAFTITISFFLMVFCAVFYSTLEDKVSSILKIANASEFNVDIPQLAFFILAVIIALYCLGIEYLDSDPDNNQDVDINGKYWENENKRVLGLETANPQSAGDGVKL